jgi:hypothetical protein
MPLALEVTTLESVPEAFRGEYTEREGKFHLNVDGIDGLKSALKKERTAAADAIKAKTALETKVARWEALGKTDEEISAMLTEAETAKLEAARKAGNFDALLADHQKRSGEILKQKETAWGTEKSTLETELAAARASERGAIIETSVMGALTKAKVTTEGVDLLTERLGKRIHFETVDGKRVIQITQADGKSPMAGNGADGAATFDDLVKEAVKQYPSLFEGTGAGGGGKPPGNGGGGKPGDKTMARVDWDKLNPYQQAANIKAGIKPVD